MSEVTPGGDSSVVIGWWQLEIDGNDDRGSFFFIWNPESRRIVSASLGHPSWSPDGDSPVIEIRPYGFFRIRGDRRTYAFAKYSPGWEGRGFAILDVATGEVVAEAR